MSMLARTAACCLILLTWVPCIAQEPVPDPGPSPAVPVIVLPHTGGDILPDPGPPPEPRPVNPAVIDTLSPDVWYVIESSVPLIILHSPDGLIGVAEEAGPLKLRGRFADEPTKVQTRTYAASNLYILDAVMAGKTELLVIPKGVESAAGIIRQVLTVSGSGPQPPPDPPDPPEPKPTATHLSIAVVEDVLRVTPDAAILFASRQWAALPDAGHDTRRYDRNTLEPKGVQAIADIAGQSLPAVAVRDKDTGKLIHTGPLPRDVGGLKALVDSLTGGK